MAKSKTSKSNMNKKGQFYIVAAVILISFAASLISPSFMGSRDRQVLRDIRDNFVTESSLAISGTAAKGKQIPPEFDDFINKFRDYSSGRNINFNLVSILLVEDEVYVKNYLDETVTIQTAFNSLQLNHTQGANLTATNTIAIVKDNRDYTFVFNENPIQLRALFEVEFAN